MEKDTKEMNEKNVKQQAHGDFLDTLGVDISGDYKRVIDVIAAIKSIDRIEKRSLARKNIKESTKLKRMAEMSENYDVVEAWLNEELEKEKEKNKEEENKDSEEPEKANKEESENQQDV